MAVGDPSCFFGGPLREPLFGAGAGLGDEPARTCGEQHFQDRMVGFRDGGVRFIAQHCFSPG